MLLLLSVAYLALASCAGQQAAEPIPRDPAVSLSCIGVLPVAPAVDYDGSLSYGDAKNLRDGRVVMDQLYRQYFGSRTDIRFATDAQIEGLDASLAGNSLAQARVIAGHMSCDAILETTLYRYRDRVGGEYSSEDPASVGFEYRLIEVASGRSLCQGKFDEQQQSVMENLLSWNRASARGFKWITAESLLREGIQDKMNACPYLAAEQ